MTWERYGRIRMNPSLSHAMQRLIGMKDRFDVAFACDTDHDRHGIVTKAGLLPSTHYMAAMVDDLFRNRPPWSPRAAVGTTVVSSRMIAPVAPRLTPKLTETPVASKWSADARFDGPLGPGPGA